MTLSTPSMGENADPQWIDALRDALDRPNEDTGVFKTGDVWDVEIRDEDVCVDDDTVFIERMETLKQLKDVRRRLSAFLGSLDAKVAAFEAKLTPASFKRGIAKLPNEILQHIFLEACDVVDDCGPERLSQVCQRFRNIATSFPMLWTAVHANMDLLALERRLELSMELPLSISLIPFGGCCYNGSVDLPDGHRSTWDEFLKLTTPHCHRWRSLYIDSGDDGENIIALLDYPGCIVPSVESLTIIYPRCEKDEAFYSQIHENWEFPNVIALRTKFLIPPSGWFNSMTECTL